MAKRNLDEKGMEVSCPRCGYDWLCKSKLYKVNCPSCGYRFAIREIPKE